MPGITTQQSFNAKPPPLHYPVPRYCLTGIVGASWNKPACWRPKWADQVLIAMNQLDHNSVHRFSIPLNSILKLSICVSCSRASARFTITTTSSLHSLMLCWRNTSLMTLFTRFRSTALGSVFLPTIIPSLAFSLPLHRKNILTCLSDIFSARITWSKPFSRTNRCAAVNLADRLDCEFCTAFGATRIDNGATSACFHAHQKTMGAFPFGY